MEINEDILDIIGASDWQVGPYGDTLICPDGNEIEADGICPDGHVSPLRTHGLI